MTDFYEIDFLAVETKSSGDAIALRYQIGAEQFIHVVDAGYAEAGERLANLIRANYGNPNFIDHVVATHPDGDHTIGLRQILSEFYVGTLWMLRPWMYAHDLLPSFSTYNSVEKLRSRLRSLYPNLAALEDIAMERGIQIAEPFRGSSIGAFKVLAPSKQRYLQCVIDSERTPETVADQQASGLGGLLDYVLEKTAKAVAVIRSAWGEEVFSPEDAGSENEMSVVQYAVISGDRIMLTADAGREALQEAVSFAPYAGIALPGIDKIQIPHHGSRRNVTSEILDQLLGQRLPGPSNGHFEAYVSSAKEDPDHPRKSVLRAFTHRGARVYQTEGQSIRTQRNAPDRAGYVPISPVPYPEEQEHD